MTELTYTSALMIQRSASHIFGAILERLRFIALMQEGAVMPRAGAAQPAARLLARIAAGSHWRYHDTRCISHSAAEGTRAEDYFFLSVAA